MNKLKKDNIVSFPSKISEIEREVEAIVFAAAEPLSVETIESKISKNTDVLKILQKLQNYYSNRGINLVCISNKWSFRKALMIISSKTVMITWRRMIHCTNNSSCVFVFIFHIENSAG